MKKKLLIGFAALAIALVAAFNINLNMQKSELSALSLANVEALARYELPDIEITCDTSCSSGGRCWGYSEVSRCTFIGYSWTSCGC